MNNTIRRMLSFTTIFALLVFLMPISALCSDGGSRLEGLMIGIDGKPATGYRVLLIGDEGQVLARAGTEEGIYRFHDLRAGSYSLGIENYEGSAAPVMSEPAQLGDGELVRLDIKLMEPGAGIVPGVNDDDDGMGKNLGIWWAGLTKRGKILALVALGAVVTTTTVILLDDDDETPASESYI